MLLQSKLEWHRKRWINFLSKAEGLKLYLHRKGERHPGRCDLKESGIILAVEVAIEIGPIHLRGTDEEIGDNIHETIWGLFLIVNSKQTLNLYIKKDRKSVV